MESGRAAFCAPAVPCTGPAYGRISQGRRGVDLDVLVQGAGARCGAPAGASPPGGPLGGALTPCGAPRLRTPVTVILMGTRRPRAICLGPLQRVRSKGQGEGGFFCKYVVGVVDKPSAAVGQEAEQKRAAKGHKYRLRVKGQENPGPKDRPRNVSEGELYI